MRNRKLSIMLVLSVLLLAALACNLPTVADNASQNVAQNNPADVQGNEGNIPAEPPAPPEPQAQPSTGGLPVFDLSDPCSIVPAAVANSILGMQVEPIPGPGVCVYTTGMVSINVAVLQGEASKLGMINEILQLEAGCSMSFSYSSDEPDPTPIPAEGQYLLEMTTQELMVKSLDLQETCGGPSFEILDHYGPGVYLLPFEMLMPGGMVSIAGGDYTLTILYIDMEQDAAASVEVARHILEMIAAGQ